MNRRFCNGMVHVIKEGENLYQLSRMYRVPLALILRANPYVDVYNLQIGQEICIPVVRPFGGMMVPPMGRPRGQGNMQETQNGMANPPDRPRDQPRFMEGDSDMPEMWEEISKEEGEGDRTVQDEGVGREMAGEAAPVEETEMAERTDTCISDGTKSLGEILREHQISVEEFLAQNDLDDIIIAADVAMQICH